MRTSAVLVALVASTSALEVKFAPGGPNAAYTVSHAGKQLFDSGDGLATFVEGAWQTPKSGLKMTRHADVSGSDEGLGKYTGTQIEWLAGQSTVLITTAKTYATGLDIAFEYSFPRGAKRTSQVKLNNSTRDEVVVNFPTFTTINLKGKLSWQGSFVGAHQNQYSTGPAGGPTVFYDPDDASLATVVVGSASNNFKATSAGPNKSWKGSDAWSPGTPATILELPEGWTQTFVMHAGSAGGITATIGEWGKTLQAMHKSYKVADVTLSKIGYQTDNGAYYVFCRGNCSRTLEDKLTELKGLGVPMGYLSFQGAGASSFEGSQQTQRLLADSHNPTLKLDDVAAGAAAGVPTASPTKPPTKIQAAPWCVNTWGVDGGLGGSYPVPLPEFQKALGVPLQLYAPYFCPHSNYFNATSNWSSVRSDTTIDGCGFYGFQDVVPDESREFYDWFFAKGKAVGMSSFEPDFMNQNYNCVPAFIESATNSTVWQHGMADSALALGVQVQWCYAAPTDVLASLLMPAVTNFRVSNDFCYGNSWDVGVSSLIVWAAGAAPSKDTLWTSTNGRFPVPGCPWTPDHEEPAVELHVIIALMTTGPVGISDALNMTDADLIKRTISIDGTLLKPSKPISSVDSAIAAASGSTSGSGQWGDALRRAPNGHVYTTYTDVAADAQTPTSSAYYFVSFKLSEPWSLTSADFYPPLKTEAKLAVRTANAKPCPSAKSTAAKCGISAVSQAADGLSAIATLPKSDFANTTGGTDLAPAVTTAWPICASGYTILGDLTKYVPLSNNRFTSVKCTSSGATATLVGAVGETVQVTVLETDSVTTTSVTLDAKGTASLNFP